MVNFLRAVTVTRLTKVDSQISTIFWKAQMISFIGIALQRELTNLPPLMCNKNMRQFGVAHEI